MTTILVSVLKISLGASIIALAVMLVRLFLINKPKVYSYALWAAVLLRLLCPFSLEIEADIPTYQDVFSGVEEYAVTLQENQSGTLSTDNGETEIGEQGDSVTPPVNSNPSPEIAPTRPHLSRSDVLFAVWILGAAAMIGTSVYSHISLKKRVETARLLEKNVCLSDRISSAFVLGITKPKIYLPKGLSLEHQKLIIEHEKTHISRGDHIVKLVSYILLAFHWFNPILWLSYSLMCADMEKSCDEAVLKKLKGSFRDVKELKKAYGRALLASAEAENSFATVSFSEGNAKSRISNVLMARLQKPGKTAIAVIVVAVTAVVLVFASTMISADREIPETVKIGLQEFPTDSTIINISAYPDIDISDIKYCKELELLDLTHCELDDISVLRKCPNLKELFLNRYTFEKCASQISSIKSLENLTVFYGQGMGMPSKRMTIKNLDCFGIVHFGEEPIDLSMFNFSDVSELQINAGATVLNLHEIENYSGMTRLSLDCKAELSAGQLPRTITHITIGSLDLSGIEKLSSLKYLQVGRVLNADLDELKNLPSLEYLYIGRVSTDDSHIHDLSFLVPLVNLKELRIPVGSSYTDLSAFAHLSNLEVLCVTGTSDTYTEYYITDISAVSSLKKLTGLHIHGTFEDISAVAELKNLTNLTLDGNFSDISAIAELNDLQELALYSGEISDISPLLKETDITFFVVYKGKIPQEQFDQFRKLNPNCYLNVYDPDKYTPVG